MHSYIDCRAMLPSVTEVRVAKCALRYAVMLSFKPCPLVRLGATKS